MESLPGVNEFTRSVIERIKRVVGRGTGELHTPVLGDLEKKWLMECIDSGYVSSVGPFVTRFEQELAAFVGSNHVVAVSSGTAGLHAALLVSGVEPNDEVIVPSLTFIATANAVTYCGAVPHFVDACPSTFGIDPEALRTWLRSVARSKNGICTNSKSGRIIRAIVPVHIFGHPCRIDEIVEVAREFGLAVIEDAAESLGSSLNNRHCGTFAQIGVVSFNGNKVLTTGAGGAVFTDNEATAHRVRHLTTTAKLPHPWEFLHDSIGFNYRMANVNAAVGLAQLAQLPSFLESKRRLALQYQDAFADFEGARIYVELPNRTSNYWLQTLILDSQRKSLRDDVLRAAHLNDLKCRPAWNPLHTLAPYRMHPRASMPVTDDLTGRVINVPSSAGLA